MRRTLRGLLAIATGLSMLGRGAPASAQDLEVAVMASPEDEIAAKRLVSELGAMDLRAHLVSGAQSTAPAVVRFLGRDRVSILCCGPLMSDRQLELVSDADPSLLALRTAERLRAQGLGRPPPAETFYTTVKPPPPPPPQNRWLTFRAGAGVLAPSPSFGPGALFSLAGTLRLAGPIALTLGARGTLSSPEHRTTSLWIASAPLTLAAGPTYVHAAGRFAVHVSPQIVYLRSSFRYRIGDRDEQGWVRQRLGGGVELVGLVQVAGPLSFFVNLDAAYMSKDPSVRRYTFRGGEAFAPLITSSLGLAWTFAHVGSRQEMRASAAR